MDPRTARRVPLWQTLSPQDPLFPGDPQFTYRIVDTIPEDGYLLEQITSLGTHTGTHISAPAHFHQGAPYLSQLDESWTLMPLVVIDVRERIANDGGDFAISVEDLQHFERLPRPHPPRRLRPPSHRASRASTSGRRVRVPRTTTSTLRPASTGTR